MVPSDATKTDGKSAQFAIRVVPSVIVDGADHCEPLSSESWKRCPPPGFGSSQVIHTRPRLSAARFGCAAPSNARDGIGVTTAAGGGSGACAVPPNARAASPAARIRVTACGVRIRQLISEGDRDNLIMQ